MKSDSDGENNRSKTKRRRSCRNSKTRLISPKSLSSTSTSKSNDVKKNKIESAKAFIAIHLGAGEHSIKKKDVYKTLCNKACQEGMKVLVNGGTSDEAVVKATIILEDSLLVNAGKGSNLTIHQTVECDAGFMSGDGFFGGVGAIPGVQNPILVAHKIADLHRDEPLLSCGRVPPTFLSGVGAKLWAQSNGIPVCEDESMVSKKAANAYSRYMEKLSEAELSSEVNDTVGAIALDLEGNVASSVSSGGNWLKHSGRVGHAPLFGCGCWSSNGKGSIPSISISTSGAGEMLSKVHLPQSIAKLSRDEASFGLVETMTSAIQHEFLHNEILTCHQEPKNVGLIALHWEHGRGEFVWGHTAKNFVIAYSSSSNKSVKMDFSELPKNKEAGKSVKVQGIVI